MFWKNSHYSLVIKVTHYLLRSLRLNQMNTKCTQFTKRSLRKKSYFCSGGIEPRNFALNYIPRPFYLKTGLLVTFLVTDKSDTDKIALTSKTRKGLFQVKNCRDFCPQSVEWTSKWLGRGTLQGRNSSWQCRSSFLSLPTYHQHPEWNIQYEHPELC